MIASGNVLLRGCVFDIGVYTAAYRHSSLTFIYL